MGPEFTLLQIAFGKFPALMRFVETGLQTFLLFVFVDVQIELEDRGAFIDQQLLELLNMIVAIAPNHFRRQFVYTHDQDIFVMATVEDHHFTFAGRPLVDAPEKIVA